MTIREFGRENEKTLLFFPGSCEPWQEFAYAAEALAERFRVLLVTPDGHDPEEGTDFVSVEKTVDDTVCWLKAHGIDRLDALYGLSFGGGMAVRFLTTQDIPAEKVVIDAGTAPYQLPKWICRLICVKDFLVFKLGRASVAAMKAAFPPERFARDPSHAAEEYREIQKYLKTFSSKTIWNIFWSANNYAVPKKAPVIPSKIRFWVGDEEWSGRYRDLKWYREYLPQIEVVTIPHMMHSEYVMMHKIWKKSIFAVSAATSRRERKNREPCENHGRYRRCMRPQAALGASQSLERSEKAMGSVHLLAGWRPPVRRPAARHMSKPRSAR